MIWCVMLFGIDQNDEIKAYLIVLSLLNLMSQRSPLYNVVRLYWRKKTLITTHMKVYDYKPGINTYEEKPQ